MMTMVEEQEKEEEKEEERNYPVCRETASHHPRHKTAFPKP
jgi:hypothetical protein